jgi:hypothetical protein
MMDSPTIVNVVANWSSERYRADAANISVRRLAISVIDAPPLVAAAAADNDTDEESLLPLNHCTAPA